ncbi:MAG: signal transduction histidine kinase [Colwellia sp.]|jgi:signal transduction histidine kinase|tara:strand:- start:10203 stop:12059 length:1857 start_codon:yes stop_codon:yes gene_type:complete
MKAMFVRLRSSFMLFIFSMGLVIGGQTLAQAETIENEKAILISKLAKYVGWPAKADQRDFVIGVYKDEEKYEYFTNFFENKGVKGKDISVRAVSTLSDAKNVHILYVSSPNQKRSLNLIERLIGDSPVLLITEDSINLPLTMVDISLDKEESKIDFKVVEANILDAKLTMPDLSYLADNKESGEVLSVSPTFALKSQRAKELSSLKSKIERQESTLSELNKTLTLSKESSQKYYIALQQKEERLEAVQQDNAKKSEKIKSIDEKLKRLETQFNEQKELLEQNQQVSATEVDGNNEETDTPPIELSTELNDELQVQNEALEKQNQALKKQNKIQNSSVIALTKAVEESKGQTSFKMLFYVFLIIAIIALIAAYMMWKKAKDSASQATVPSKNEDSQLLVAREEQLIKSENFAAIGYIASDITYAVGLSLDDLQAKLETAGDTNNTETLKPIVTLLTNFNLIAADQDDTSPQSFDVIAYIQKMMMLYEFEFSQSDIVYNYSGEKALNIKSVPSYIALILLNIVNNSLKHGFNNNGNGKIALKVEKGLKGGARITYSDDGKGMNKATLEQVFTPFFTTQSSRGYVGIGMSTTYNLVKNKLAADIKIDSQEGKGTTVTITLP